MEQEFGLVVFDSTQQAMHTDGILKEHQIHHRVMTIPGSINAGCGLCIQFDVPKLEAVRSIMVAEKIIFNAVYVGHRQNLVPTYTRIYTSSSRG